VFLANPVVVFIENQIIAPALYVLFALLVILMVLLLVLGILWVVYRIVERFRQMRFRWMAFQYIRDAIDYAEKNDLAFAERKRNLESKRP